MNTDTTKHPMQYPWIVTKYFTGGLLEGLTVREYWSFEPPAVGFRCERPIGGSPYEIIAVERVA